MIHKTPTREEFDAAGDPEEAPISRQRYEELLEKELWLRCLEAVVCVDLDRAFMLLAQARESD